jgi:serine-type D-Ala-D-Ala carboxypeptidase/endopeptidase (penicillin-binding protein 4)
MTRREARSAPAKKAPREAAKQPRSATTTPRSATTPPAAAGTTGGSGIAGVFVNHKRVWIGAALGVAFLMLGTGAVFAGAAVGSGDAAVVPVPTATAAAGRSLPAELPAESRLRTCSIASLAADPRLMTFSGAVRNATTGELLFDRAASAGVAQASVLKLLTAAAALNILLPDTQLSTRVYEGSSPGTIVLVGGGDPTISALHSGESVYTGAPKLDDLAAQVKANYDPTVTKIVLDASLWSTGDKWDDTWKRSEQTKGYLSEVTALQVDGDRADPTAAVSPRSTDPVARAGTLFALALEHAGVDIDPSAVTFSLGSAVTTKPILGEVKSQPISVLINQMLVMSDGTLAESLARLVSKSMGLGGSAASLGQAIPSALAVFEVDTTGLVIRDGSGLSTSNAVPPAFMTDFLTKVLVGGQELNYIFNSLAVAGKTGSLASRFSGDSAAARGNVYAKTGWIDTEYSLAGTINAADGTQLTFAFYAVGAGIKSSAQAALDAVTTGAFSCGDNLSNN